jgi:peptidoglycan/LPS O-acetylase OafA/YrhL
LTAFSLRSNWNELVTTKTSNDIASAHGIRLLNTVMLIVSHKCMELDFNPMPNRNDIAVIGQSPITVIVRGSYLYTDAFIMLSAMLISYSFIGRLNKNVKINITKEIAARYFRVVPPMAALILFGTFILPIISDGPQWGMLINNQAELCKKTWWRNFFMIHNWFGFENICMTHTHHIGTDFQLFLFAPILIILLHKYPKRMSAVIFILSVASTFGRFYVTHVRNMTVYVQFGIK